MVTNHDPSLPQWKGLFEWSTKHTDPTSAPANPPSAQDIAWLEEAMRSNMLNVAKRMRDIKDSLDQKPEDQGAPSLQQREDLLDELLDIVEDINFARDMRPVGGLPTLLALLAAPEPSLRARAAAVLAACAQNNLPTQQWLLNEGALPPLLGQLQDGDTAARVAAFTAVAALVRNFPPGLEAFLQLDGGPAIIARLGDSSPRVVRKAALLLTYMAEQKPDAAPGIAQQGAADEIPSLLRSDDRDLREAGLQLALALAKHPDAAKTLFEVPEFETALRQLRSGLDQLPTDDADSAREEAELSQLLAALHADPPKQQHTTRSEITENADAPPLLLGPPS